MKFATEDIDVRWENGDTPSIYFKSRRKDAVRRTDRGSVTALPRPALPPGKQRLRYADLKLATDIVPLFSQLDDLLHRSGHVREDRHTILLKLLLVKLYDEDCAQRDPGEDMLIQDFSAVAPAWDSAVEKIFSEALDKALHLYNGVLARAAPRSIGCKADVLREVSSM